MPNELQIGNEARSILEALASRKNVIITGPPGTGKSKLLNEVRELFKWQQGQTGAAPLSRIPIPAAASALPDWFPSPSEDVRRDVYQTVFDQNTKYRDFLRGLAPKIGEAGTFEVTVGTLYRASLSSMVNGNAALVIIDEINRGPAVAAFGSALVGLEADKRLPRSGIPSAKTQYFEILGDNGEHEAFALPEDLYILAAMNEADSSVEPLDVAFLRRFHIHRLEPDEMVLRRHLGLPSERGELPDYPTEAVHYFEALSRTFSKVNQQIALGRGGAYRLGHGALMHEPLLSNDLQNAKKYLSYAWGTLRGHLDEVYFGNTRALSDILCAEHPDSPYQLLETTFAGQTVRRISGPARPTPNEIYRLMVVMAGDGGQVGRLGDA